MELCGRQSNLDLFRIYYTKAALVYTLYSAVDVLRHILVDLVWLSHVVVVVYVSSIALDEIAHCIQRRA